MGVTNIMTFYKLLAVTIAIYIAYQMISPLYNKEQSGLLSAIGLDTIYRVSEQKDVPTCPVKSRVDWYKDQCLRLHVGSSRVGQNIGSVMLDYDKKTFGCLNAKAGSISWSAYMLETKGAECKDCGTHNKSYFGAFNLERVAHSLKVPEVLADYKAWTKYMIVRHPLQRLVAGYYEAIVKHHVHQKADGTAPTFKEFAERMVSGELINQNPHWAYYSDWCHYCDISYDMIIKQETLDEDSVTFNNLNGLEKDIRVDLGNLNKVFDNKSAAEGVGSYKYDNMLYNLQKEDPELMRNLLKLYEYDMKAFGYHWDWNSGQSSCGYNHDGVECC